MRDFEEEFLLSTDTRILSDEEKIKKNKIMVEKGLEISKKDRELFKEVLKQKINLTHDFIEKSKINKISKSENKKEIDVKKRKKDIVELISLHTGIDSNLIKKTIDEVDILLDDKMLIRSIFKLLSMRSVSNSLKLTSCINKNYSEEYKDILEELEIERKKAYFVSLLKEFSELSGMSLFIIKEGLKIKNIELDLTKEKDILLEELKKIFT